MNKKIQHGKIIFLNGTSSSGKTTIAKKLQDFFEEPYLYVSVDNFLHQLSERFLKSQNVMDRELSSLISGFHASVAAMAQAGNRVLLDHVLQEEVWLKDCLNRFASVQVIFIGVKCPLEELERRETERVDRQKGLAKYQFDKVHRHKIYDVEIDTSKLTIQECVDKITKYLESNKKSEAFKKLIKTANKGNPGDGKRRRA